MDKGVDDWLGKEPYISREKRTDFSSMAVDGCNCQSKEKKFSRVVLVEGETHLSKKLNMNGRFLETTLNRIRKGGGFQPSLGPQVPE